MNAGFEDSRKSFSSIIEPKLNPATAAVEKLKFYPTKGLKRVRLLSERDEDYFHSSENDDPHTYDQPTSLCDGGSFDMTSLSRISESISKEHGQSITTTNNGRFRAMSFSTQLSTNPTRDFYSHRKLSRNQDIVAKKQRRLVRCIAWDSQLAKLDSSSPSRQPTEVLLP